MTIKMRLWRMLKATETHHSIMLAEVAALDQTLPAEISGRRAKRQERVELMVDERR